MSIFILVSFWELSLPAISIRYLFYVREVQLTEISPTPTNGVNVDVKTELDWTRNVIIAPTKIAT